MLEHKNRDCFSMQFCQQNLSPDCGMAPNELCDVLNRLTLFKQSSHGFFFSEEPGKKFLCLFSRRMERRGFDLSIRSNREKCFRKNEAIIEMEFFFLKVFAEKRPIFNDS